MSAFEAAPPHRSGGWAGLRLTHRLGVYLSRRRLDRKIAAGWPCEMTAALALRSRQLTDFATRRRIARQLRGVVDYVDRFGSRRMLSAVVIDPTVVADGRMPILRLAARLEDPAPVSPRGTVLAQELLTDGCGPFFNRRCMRSVAEAVLDVEDALEPDPDGGRSPRPR